MDIDTLIKKAKIGRARKDAQEDTCAVFAAALYDVLSECGVPCKMVEVSPSAATPWLGRWSHAVVDAGGRLYDSMGEFSTAIYRARAKIHPKVGVELTFRPDRREECFEIELADLHAFYVQALQKQLRNPDLAEA